jgi:hypothetical protein
MGCFELCSRNDGELDFDTDSLYFQYTQHCACKALGVLKTLKTSFPPHFS